VEEDWSDEHAFAKMELQELVRSAMVNLLMNGFATYKNAQDSPNGVSLDHAARAVVVDSEPELDSVNSVDQNSVTTLVAMENYLMLIIAIQNHAHTSQSGALGVHVTSLVAEEHTNEHAFASTEHQEMMVAMEILKCLENATQMLALHGTDGLNGQDAVANVVEDKDQAQESAYLDSLVCSAVTVNS